MFNKILFLIIFIILIMPSLIKISIDDLNQEILYSINIKGAIKEKDVVLKLKPQTTIFEALEYINLNDNADTSRINLASYIYPEMVIVIDEINDNKLISINSATLDDLIRLSGIKEAIAQRIIDYRNNHGSFNDLIELKKVKGIGDKTYEKIKEFITL